MTKVRHKVFGKDNRPTIYYCTGYGSVIRQYLPHIYSLVASGFRVVAFDYDKSIVSAGDPERLISTVKRIEKIVSDDKKNRDVAGMYGVSLGTWISGAVMIGLDDITHVVFNSGGCSLANVIWTKDMFADAKSNFKKHGHTVDELEKFWSKLDVRLVGEKFSNRTLLLLSGIDDEIVSIDEARESVQTWRAHNNDVTFVEIANLNHVNSIKRNMLRVKSVKEFFNSVQRYP